MHAFVCDKCGHTAVYEDNLNRPSAYLATGFYRVYVEDRFKAELDLCGKCFGRLLGRVRDGEVNDDFTSQWWISVEERLPTEQDADDVGAVLAVHKAARKRYYHWRSVVDNPFDFTFWMPLPTPPKGE